MAKEPTKLKEPLEFKNSITTKIKEPSEFEDSIISGILKAKGCRVTPKKYPERSKVVYLVEGDWEKALQEIYENSPIGCLDVLQAIKFTRSAIFALKGRRE